MPPKRQLFARRSRGCEALEPRWLLSAGELDASFDGDGWCVTEFGLGFNFDRAFAVEIHRGGPLHGRIVVAGESILAGQSANFAVARYLPNGSFDTSFGGNGRVTTNVGGAFVGAYDMVLQSDGKVLVVGEGRGGSTDDLTIVRYETDGSPDMSFGNGGIVQTDLPGMFGAPSKDTALAVAVDSQGRILVAGQAATAFGTDVVVARYLPTGGLDNSFNFGAGFIIRSFGGTDWAYDIAVDPTDDSFVVAASGGFAVPGAVHQFPGVMRFLANGTPDTTFGTGGITQLTLNGDDVSFMEVELDSQGRIVISGTVRNDADRRGFVTRLLPNGSFDTFGTAGVTEVVRNAPFTSDSAVHVYGMSLQDDTIVLVGSWQLTDVLVARLDDTGAFIPFAPGIDSPDANDNFVIADFGGIDEAWDIALDEAFRWVVVGAGGPGLSRDFVVARFEGPPPPLDFGDAPASYGTLLADNGARHLLIGPRLGTLRDDELDGQSSLGADGDDVGSAFDDEDGVIDPLTDLKLTEGDAPSVRLRVTNDSGQPATLSGWIDYNGDGTFDNATERAQTSVPDGAIDAQVALAFPRVPTGSAPNTFARFRISTFGSAANPTGPANDGEVEDYAVTIPPADLAIALDDDENEVTVGQRLTYTFAVSNLGPGAAADVAVSATLDPTVSFLAAGVGSPSFTQQGDTLTFDVGHLTAGASVSFGISVIPSAAGSITATAMVTSPTTDTNASNDAATTSTIVVAEPVVEIPGNYVFRIVDVGEVGSFIDPLFNRSAPSINGSGTLVYRRHNADDTDTLLVASGGMVAPVLESGELPAPLPPQRLFVASPSINDAGTIVFTANRSTQPNSSSGYGIFVLDATGTLTELRPVGPSASFPLPFVNNNDTVLFADVTPGAGPAMDDVAILTHSSGQLNTIVDTSAGTYSRASYARINDANVVAFFGAPTGGVGGLFVSDGVVTTPILTLDTPTPGINWHDFREVSLNNSGTIAFQGQYFAADSTFGQGLFTTAGGDVTVIAESGEDVGAFTSYNAIDMGDSGQVVFLAALVQAGQGIFVGGPDGPPTKVIAAGDALFGSQVSHLDLRDGGANAAGQIAFAVRLEDGRELIVVAEPDSDLDNVPEIVEAAAPNAGDGNGDGVPDADQAHVASIPSATNGTYVTIEAIDGAMPPSVELVNVQATADVGTPPSPGVSLPLGVVSFEVRGVAIGATVIVELTLHGPIVPQLYYKFGPEPGDSQDHWWEFTFDGTTGARINGNVVTLTFVDGGRGDADGMANGVIVDPGAPAIVTAALTGDYNKSGQVEQGDLDLVLLHWGESAVPAPEGWVSDLPEGNIDQDELDAVLLHWGATSAASAIAEPVVAPLVEGRKKSYTSLEIGGGLSDELLGYDKAFSGMRQSFDPPTLEILRR